MWRRRGAVIAATGGEFGIRTMADCREALGPFAQPLAVRSPFWPQSSRRGFGRKSAHHIAVVTTEEPDCDADVARACFKKSADWHHRKGSARAEARAEIQNKRFSGTTESRAPSKYRG